MHNERSTMIGNLEGLIKSLIKLPAENEYVEFKTNFTEPEREGRDISALANSAAYHDARFAYKIWGIEDSTHKVVGTTFSPTTEKVGNASLVMWLAQNLSDNAGFDFEEGDYDGKKITVLRIWPALHHPVEFQHQAYMRKGSHTQKVKSGSTDEHELWNHIQKQDFEKQIALEGLSPEEVFELLDVNRYFDTADIPRPTSLDAALHYFETEHLAFLQDDGLVAITNMGALLFAHDLEKFPSVRRKKIRVSRYGGKGRSAGRSEREFNGGYALELETLYNYLEGMLEQPDIVNGVKREKQLAYSEVALRELIVNALIHQNLAIRGAGPLIEVFENRIEITNPGAPLIQVERIVNDPPRSRNEDLSALMRRFSYCEESGTGWDKVIEGCEAYQAPAPKIEIQTEGSDSMRVVLFQPKAYKAMTMSERLDACYWHACVLFANREYISNASLRERFGLESSKSAQISRLIKEAVEAGLIKPVEANASQKYMRYLPFWA